MKTNLLLVTVVLLGLGGVALAEEDRAMDICQSPHSRDIEKCLSNQVEVAQASLDRYLAACRKACAVDKKDLSALDAAQKSWLSYVEADCKAQYQHWSDGTIRSAQYLSC